MEFLGFSFSRKKKDQDRNLIGPVPRDFDDGAGWIDGGHYGYFIDMDGTLRSDTDLIRKYREMALHSDVDLAINDIVNEVITVDAREELVKLNLDKATSIGDQTKGEMQKAFKEVLELLDFERSAYDIFRNYYIDGRLYYQIILHDEPSKGAKEYRKVDPLRIRKVRQVVEWGKIGGVDVPIRAEDYFIYLPANKQDPTNGTNYLINMDATEKGIRLAPDSINFVHSGLYDANGKKIYGFLHKAIKPLNQLRMVEDATVIYRWSRAPERRIFYVDVGNMPKTKAEQYLKGIMDSYKNKLVYDATTGEIRDDKRFMGMLEDFWLPRRSGGQGTQVDTLPGGQNLGEMDDVLYFQKKLLRSLNIPITRLEADNGFNMGRASEITRDELKYAKWIDRLRNKFGELLLNFLKVQVITKKIMNEDDWEKTRQYIKLEFARDSYFAESKQSEVLKDRAEIVNTLAPFIGTFVSKHWIRKNVLRQTDEDILEMDREIALENEQDAAEMAETQKNIDAAGGPNGMNGQAPGGGPGGPGQPGPYPNQSVSSGENLRDASSLL